MWRKNYSLGLWYSRHGSTIFNAAMTYVTKVTIVFFIVSCDLSFLDRHLDYIIAHTEQILFVVHLHSRSDRCAFCLIFYQVPFWCFTENLAPFDYSVNLISFVRLMANALLNTESSAEVSVHYWYVYLRHLIFLHLQMQALCACAASGRRSSFLNST